LKSEFKTEINKYIKKEKEKYKKLPIIEKQQYDSGKWEYRKNIYETMVLALLNSVLPNGQTVVFDIDKSSSKENLFNYLIKQMSPFEFYLKTQMAFFHKMMKESRMKVKENDFGDLFNLVYVSNDNSCFYFTEERRWNILAIEAGLGDKLIEGNTLKRIRQTQKK
jgi:hypothetical protein